MKKISLLLLSLVLLPMMSSAQNTQAQEGKELPPEVLKQIQERQYFNDKMEGIIKAQTDQANTDMMLKIPETPTLDENTRNLVRAIMIKDVAQAEKAINAGANINAKIEHRPVLTLAIRFQAFEIVKLLLEQKEIDVNAQDKYGNSPLHTAVEVNNPEIAEMLIDHQADLDLTNKQDKMPEDLIQSNQNEMGEVFSKARERYYFM